jgi:hypothetical protein
LPTVGLGDDVVLRPEPESGHDKFAVVAPTRDGEMLGHVPRCYGEGVSHRLACGMTYACTIIGDDRVHGCESCLKVRLVIPED